MTKRNLALLVWVLLAVIAAPAADDKIEVVALGPRRSIYEETLRLLQVEESK